MTIAEEIIAFNLGLKFTGSLPENISLLNPFRDNPAIMPVVAALMVFSQKDQPASV